MVERLRRIGINLSITSIAIDSYIAVISLTRVFQTFSISQEEMMSEGGDHESWDDEMMMNENNETPLPVVRIVSSFFFYFFITYLIYDRFGNALRWYFNKLCVSSCFAAIVHVQGWQRIRPGKERYVTWSIEQK